MMTVIQLWFLALLFESCFLQVAQEDTTCYTICSDKVTSDCKKITSSECSSVKGGHDVGKPDLLLPFLLSAEVYTLKQTPDRPPTYGLSFSWSPSTVAENSTSATYRVTFKSETESCQTFIFQDIFNLPVFHACIPELGATSPDTVPGTVPDTVSVILEETVFNVSAVHYVMKLPDKIQKTIDPASLSEWQAVIGVAADFYNRAIQVVFTPLPSHFNVSAYQVLLYSENRTVVRKVTLTQEEKQLYHVFSGLQARLKYYVTVGTSGCDSTCSPTSSVVIYLPGEAGDEGLTVSTAITSFPSPASTPPSLVNTGPTSTQDGSVIVQPADKRRLYEKSVMIILGTVFGVVGTVIVLGVFCFYWYRRSNARQSGNFPMQRFAHGRDSDSSIGMEHAYKQQQPSVMLVYSYDCPAHEQLVLRFADFLSQAGNCEVCLDVYDQVNVESQGIRVWVQDKLEVAQYILVICSTGARFKCAKHRKFRLKQDRPLPDAFAWTVDLIAEKMRTAHNTGEITDRFLVAYFEPAGESDVPPKLDRAQRFILMRDILELYCHLHGLKPETVCHDDGALHNGLTPETYHKSEIGKQLHDALMASRTFLKDNPDWLGQIIVPLTPPANPVEHPPAAVLTQPQSPHLSQTRNSPSLSSQEDLFVEERKKRHVKDRKRHSDTVHSVDKVPLMSTPPPPCSQPSIQSSTTNKPAVSMTVEDEEEEEVEEEEEEEDLAWQVDAIRNFDAYHEGEWWNPAEPQLVQDNLHKLELRGYTPPDHYISQLSLRDTFSSPELSPSPPSFNSPMVKQPHASPASSHSLTSIS